MTTKTNAEQMRATFENWYMKEFEVYPKKNESGGFRSPYVNVMFMAFSAGRADGVRAGLNSAYDAIKRMADMRGDGL